MKRLLLMLCLSMVSIGAIMAQRAISGTITDGDGEPLIGANVIVSGTTIGAVTDFDGRYQLEVPSDATTLSVSYTGFETREVPIGVSNVIDISMSEGILLEAAVVTALGVSRDEKTLGYAVQTLGGDDIKAANTVNAIDALSGKTAGVMVTPASGAAGAPSRIVLRGQTSFNGDNEALIVVDGVRLDNSENHSERSLGGVANSSRGMDLNPDDIESVSVLKGGAATALYGAEGARGVVLITTKKGANSDGLKINFSSNYTLAEYNKMPELQNKFTQGFGGQWAGPSGSFIPSAVSWGALADTMAWNGNSDYKWDSRGELVSQNDPSAKEKFVPYNNVDDFYQTGTTWTNNLSFNGGNDQYTYRVSFGHTNQKGIVPLNTFKRTNVSFGGTAKFLDDRLNVSSSINYVNSGGRRIQQGSNISGVNLGLFRTPISFDNSNGISDEPWNNPLSYSFADNSQRNYRAGGGYDNPYWIVAQSPFNDEVNRMYGNIRVAYDLTNWFTLATTVGTDFYSDLRKQEFEIGSRAFPAGQILDDKYNYRHTDIFVNGLGNVDLSDDLTFGYNVGVNLYNEQLENLSAQGDGLNFYGFRDINNTQTITTILDNSNQRSFGVFGSVDLGYKNFLYLTLTGRNDWLSTLIAPSRAFDAGAISVFYPSASLGIDLTEKLPTEFFDFFKIRGSWAQVGGGAPSSYQTATYFLPQNTQGTINDLNDGWTNGILFPFNGQPGFTQNAVLGNPDLVPSLTTDLEVGADIRFLNNRVGLDVSYYKRNSEDQIIAINIPNSTGYQRQVINSGELQTKGAEVVLNLTPIRSAKGLTWDLGFNFSTWKTTVESLPEGVPNQYLDGFTGTGVYNIAPIVDDNGNVVQTYEYGQIFGGAFQHVNDPNDENGDGSVFDPDKPYAPDAPLVIGADGYPLEDPLQRVIGNPNPDFLLGINNTFTYKNLTLSALIDIRQGGDIWNGTKGALTFFGRSKLTEDRDVSGSEGTYVFDGVLADGSKNEQTVPLDENWYLGNGGGFGNVDEHFVEDGGFTRLRQLTLSYSLPRTILGDAVEALTLSFTGRNLWLSTDYTGVDPETSLVGSSSNGQGLEYFQFPNTKSYAFGLNVTF